MTTNTESATIAGIGRDFLAAIFGFLEFLMTILLISSPTRKAGWPKRRAAGIDKVKDFLIEKAIRSGKCSLAYVSFFVESISLRIAIIEKRSAIIIQIKTEQPTQRSKNLVSSFFMIKVYGKA